MNSALKSLPYLIIFVLACIPSWISIALDVRTPFDEIAHFDYAEKLANLKIPKVYEQYGQTALKTVACDPDFDGEAWSGVKECDVPYIDPSRAPFFGQSSATSYAPTYYGVIAINYRICTATFGELTHALPITCMQISNSLLAGFSVLLLVATGIMIGLPRLAIASAALIAVNSPAMVQQFATVNSDAGALLAVALCIFLAVWLPLRQSIRQERPRPVSLLRDRHANKIVLAFIGLCGIAVSMKETSLLIVPTSAILFVALLNKDRYSENLEPSRKVYFIDNYLYPLSISGAVVILVSGFRWAQPHLRGLGGNDWMGKWLREDRQSLSSEILQPISHLLNSGSQTVAEIYSDSVSRNLSIFIGFLFVLALLFGFLEWQKLTSDKDRVFTLQVFGTSTQIGVLTVPIMATILGLFSLIQAGFVSSQPRYYLPVTILFAVFGVGIVFSFIRSWIALAVVGIYSILLCISFFWF